MTATLSNALHGQQTIFEGIHSIVSYVFNDAPSRLSSSTYIPADLYKVAFQADNQSLWVLINTASILWIPLNGSGSTFSGTFSTADVSASYLVLQGTSSLPNERMFATGSGLTGLDGGPGGVFLLSINNNVVATLTGSTFSGPVVATGGLTGSLQQISPGLSYLVAGANVSIVSQSNGQVVVSAATPPAAAADVSASYVTIGNTGSLPNERALTAGTGLTLADGGANSTVTLGINNNVVATLSGSVFTGVVSASAGLSGSLQQVGPGIPYLLSQGSITITTKSNGQVIISGSTVGTNINVSGGDAAPSYLILNSTASLPNERVFSVSGTSGLKATDTGSGGTLSLAIDNSIVATISGATFTGATIHNGGLSGSLQRLPSGQTYIAGAGSVLVTTSSTGQVVISSPLTSDVSASYVTIGNTGSLPNERALTAGTGLILIDGGANSTVTLGVNNNVVATLSGSVFTGVVSASAGLSGSIQQVGPGLSYLVAGNLIAITSQSNGQIVIASTASTTDVSASYVTIGNTGSLPNERALVAGTGLTLADGGAGSTVSLGINNNVVATLSGSVFTGVVSASAGLSGSLQQVGPGIPYLLSQGSITLITMSNGQVIISGSSAGGGTTNINVSGGDPGPSYLVLNTTASLSSERVFSVSGSSGLKAVDSGPNGNLSLSIDNSVVATLSGSTFTGPVSASAGLSGSLQQVGPGLSYLVAGNLIAITSQSSGQIIIASTASTSDVSASYVTIGNTGSLPNERALAAGVGLTLIDGGAGSSVTLGINNNVVATLSGSVFTGVVSASAGLSGSLQQVGPGIPYLLSQGSITITTMSNGQVIISGSSAGSTTNISGGDPGPSYLVLNTTASLSSERVFNVSGSSGLKATDSGPNGTLTLSIDNSVVATISGTTFTGPVLHNGGMSGSLQQVSPGLSYLVAGTNITVTSQSNGQVVVASTLSSGFADVSASYVTIGNTGSLPNERSLTAGTGLTLTDGGANSSATFAINNNVVATLSGSVFTGVVSASAGLSGSLQQVGPGIPYLLSQGSITLITMSNGQVIISGSSAGSTTNINVSGGDPAPTYLVLSNTASLSSERVFSVSGTSGLKMVDGGPNATLSLSIDNSVVATLTGSVFTGPISASSGLSGSLQQVGPGLSYLVAGQNVTVVSQSNGQIVVSSTSAADVSASYVTIGNTGSLPNERALTTGTGLTLIDGGANSTVTLGINNNVVATLSGSVFTGVVSASAGLSGSIQQVGPGLSYLVAGTNVTITSQSNGQIVIASVPLTTGFADVSASYVTIGNTGSLPNERSLTTGTGLTLTDAGANSSVTLGINNNVVATLTGSVFTGVVSASAGLSGSLQQVGPGIPYLLSQGSITITTMSNGQVIISGSSVGTTTNITVSGGDPAPSYLVLNTTASLSNERALSVSGTSGLKAVDSGANGTLSLSIDNSVVATLTGSIFTGVVSASAGLSGSIQQVGPGLSYLVAGQNVTVTSQSNGQIIIAASQATGFADVSASYVTIGNTGSLPNERNLTTGTGLNFSDGGAGGNVSLSVNPTVVAMITGAIFTGPVQHNGGLSGSLQQVSAGVSYLVAGANITVTSQSNGQVVIASTATGGSGADVSASYVTIGNTGSLPNERALSAGTGLTLTDGGANSTATFAINNNVVATLSGSVFTGVVSASSGLSGSIQQVGPGLSYLVAGNLIAITSQSNGQIVIASTASTTDVSASYITIGNTGSLPNERSLAAGTGLILTDGGANSTVTLGINNNVVATLSGSVFTGVVSASAGLSGSLQQVGPGLPYLLSQGSITITTKSNGQIIISGSAGSGGGGGTTGGGDPGASYLVLNTTASLSNERAFVVGQSLSAIDTGAGGNYTLGFNNALSGTLTASNNDVASAKAITFFGEFNAGSSGGSFTIDWNKGQKQVITLTAANVTASFIPPVAGVGNYQLRVVQDTTGSRSIANYPATTLWSFGQAPTLTPTPGGIDILSFFYNSSSYYGAANLAFSGSGVPYLIAGSNVAFSSSAGSIVISFQPLSSGIRIVDSGLASIDPLSSATLGPYVLLTGETPDVTVFAQNLGNDSLASWGGDGAADVRWQFVNHGLADPTTQFEISIINDGIVSQSCRYVVSALNPSGTNYYIGTMSDPGATYLILSGTASLGNARKLVPGTSMVATDGGVGQSYTLSFNNALSGALTASNNDIVKIKAVTFNGEFNIGTVAGSTFTWNLNNGQKQVVTLASNTTASISGSASGVGNFLLRIIQDNTGSRGLLVSGAKYPGGTVPTWSTATGSIDILSLYWNGITPYCQAGIGFA